MPCDFFLQLNKSRKYVKIKLKQGAVFRRWKKIRDLFISELVKCILSIKLDSEKKFPDHQLIIGNIRKMHAEDIVFVVYTERIRVDLKGKNTEVTRLISARLATSFERGLYYGKYE